MAETKNNYQTVLNELRDMFFRGELKTGSRLPSEREMAEHFHVSRVPVREAIKILEFVGLVRVTQGGMFVQNAALDNLISNISLSFSASKELVIEMMEVRSELECIAAKFATERRTHENLKEMASILEEMRSCIQDKDLESEEAQQILQSCSCRFHMEIFYATQNEVLIKMYQSLYGLLERSMSITGSHSGSIKRYENLLAYISSRDGEHAQAEMRAHMKGASTKLAKALYMQDN